MVMLPLAAFTAVFLWDGPPQAGAVAVDANRSTPIAARFGLCSGMGRLGGNCVIDGDTFWYEGEKIRVADINTPEVSEPGCAREAELGAAATDRLQALLNEGAFELENVDRDRDQYGRLLRVVTREGESLGATMVAEGLAEEWQGYRRDWC
jgi:micrococcal nuclease